MRMADGSVARRCRAMHFFVVLEVFAVRAIVNLAAGRATPMPGVMQAVDAERFGDRI